MCVRAVLVGFLRGDRQVLVRKHVKHLHEGIKYLIVEDECDSRILEGIEERDHLPGASSDNARSLARLGQKRVLPSSLPIDQPLLHRRPLS